MADDPSEEGDDAAADGAEAGDSRPDDAGGTETGAGQEPGAESEATGSDPGPTTDGEPAAERGSPSTAERGDGDLQQDPPADGEVDTAEDQEGGAPEDGEGPATDAPADEAAPETSGPDQPSAGADPAASEGADAPRPGVPEDVARYERFTKMDGAQYERVNEFLRDRTYITAREWAIARLCADFRTETGVEMTKIGENLPELVPFMTDTYTPQAVNQARASFEDKVTTAGATFLYGAMSDFFTADELDDLMYEVTEVAKFLLEVEGVDLSVEEELEAEERISQVMREVRRSSDALRHDDVQCPNCGTTFEPAGED